jgi:hypothetical protein
VFISHTSELRDYPKGQSYMAAVERAVSAAGHVIVDMKDFPAADQTPAQLCADVVRRCDVYVGVLGTRYGSLVPDKPEVSYTELEFDTATEAGLPRLVFVLDTNADNVGIPVSALIDEQFGARQAAFRARAQGGLVTQSFTDPATLGQLVERSLRELAGQRRHRGSGNRRDSPAEERKVLLRATRIMRSGESQAIEIFDAELANQWVRIDPWGQPQSTGAANDE